MFPDLYGYFPLPTVRKRSLPYPIRPMIRERLTLDDPAGYEADCQEARNQILRGDHPHERVPLSKTFAPGWRPTSGAVMDE